MPQMANRIQETTTTGGTGTLTLAGAVTGYLTFAAGFSTGASLFYTIDNGVGEWEIGIGTLVTTGTLSRVTVIASSNGGALVNFGSGTKRVFCSAPTRSLVPDQDNKSGYVLTTDGTDPAWTQTLNGITIGNLTAAGGAFTTLSASSTVSGTGFSTYLASPPAIGGTAPAAGAFTTLSASSTVSGTGFSTYLASPPAIGGTTPAAGAFTTLSSTGNTTLGDAAGDTLTINAGTTTFAQGTASGVAYLNGSKVLTTGSALTFDGTKLVGTASGNSTVTYPAYFNNDGSGVGVGTRIGFRNGASSYGDFGFLYDGAFSQIIDSAGSSSTRFLIGGSEQMRLTSKGLLVGYTSDSSLSGTGNAIFSGNVGIGTSSPATYGLLSAVSSASQPLAQINALTSSGYNSPFTASVYIGSLRTDNLNNGAAAGYRFKTYAADATGANLTIESASSATGSSNPPNAFNMLVTLSSSGNLGLGVTPSAWNTGKAIQVGGLGASIWGAFNNTYLSQNYYYYNSGGKYAGTGYALQYIQVSSNGEHQWLTAPSGTAGDAISFTQAMTLDASGNLGVGATSPEARIHAKRAGAGSTIAWMENGSGVGVALYAGNTSWSTTSDETVKDIIGPITDAVIKVNTLRSVIGMFKEDESNSRKAFLIAQDVKKVLPEAVSIMPTGKLGIQYTDTIPLLVAAIKELTARLESLEQRIN